ncbi:MAG: carboxypeptidase-like regulatory domain-containing protein [Bacilli bacterium]|nr:carboxypeptidase-like regulatory domain-containing protein [Bacilli bacterium]
MKKICLMLILLIIAGICIPAVSAEIVSETYIESGDNYFTKLHDMGTSQYKFNTIYIKNPQLWQGLKTVYLRGPVGSGATSILTAEPDYSQSVTLKVNNDVVGYGTANYNALMSEGSTEYNMVQIWVEFDNIDLSSYTDAIRLTVIPTSGLLWNDIYIKGGGNLPADDNTVMFAHYYNSAYYVARGLHISYSKYDWQNRVEVTDNLITIIREIDGNNYTSTIEFSSDLDYGIETSNIDRTFYFIAKPLIWTITSPHGINYTGSYGYDTSELGDITVYIKNSQTGAAIANSRCVIDALVDGDYHPVVNRTEPSGVFSVTLQHTGGGRPNPDGYRLIASADGYNNPMPEINFTVDEYTTSIYCYLDPIAGGPLDENNTFIDFFVRDMSANPISGATVKFGDYTLLTNSQGYTVFEVGKNATYTYTVSKSGYGSLTGNAVIGADSRHIINTVLAPAVTPTTPTSIPTSTYISPNPTLTAPTGEPVSNWLDWFAAHFGMILGGGVEIGKIFMWLCFAVPVGVYVGKEAKAGAAGFMAGAGIVTLFFVLIGWVPIWLLVLLALIIGLLYANVFNSSDTGGGR